MRSRWVAGAALAVALAWPALNRTGTAQTPPAAPVIRVDRARAGIPLGASLTINVSGPNGPLAVHVPYDGVDAAYDPLTHRLTLTGRTPGSGTVTLTDRDGDSASIALLVALPAGALPPSVDVALAGNVTAPFVTARIRDSIERALVRQAGTGIDIHGLTIPPLLAPGDTLEAQAGVALDGHGTYVDVVGRISVHVHVDPQPPLRPVTLFYSDDPEYIGAQLSGVLIRGTIDAQTPARLFVYHVADKGPRTMWLVLHAAMPAHVQELGTISGASPAFTYIGQQSSARFLAAYAGGESAILPVAAGVPYVIPLGSMQPGDLIEAVQDLRVVDGGPVTVTVATSPAGSPLPALDGPELAGDTHGRRGVFALGAIAPIDLSLTTGGPEPLPLPVGDTALANQRADGRALGGDYGIVRPLALHLANPSAQPQQVYLYELTSGAGGTTTTVWFNGEPAVTAVPCVDDATQPHLIKAFALAAGEVRVVTGTFMTDGAGTYPVRFGLTATPPASPAANGCAPTLPSPVP